MAEAALVLPDEKPARYAALRESIAAVIAGEGNRTARLATACALLRSAFPETFFWCGFYLVDPDKPGELVIGPYQGTLGCLRIAFGRGVCGHVAQTQRTEIVPDVHAFPGHIACDSRSLSEIVVPLFEADGAFFGVLDVDSDQRASFDAEDAAGLEAICADLMTGP
jgi:GAF domain-containing protein